MGSPGVAFMQHVVPLRPRCAAVARVPRQWSTGTGCPKLKPSICFILILTDDWGQYTAVCLGNPVALAAGIGHLARSGLNLEPF